MQRNIVRPMLGGSTLSSALKLSVRSLPIFTIVAMVLCGVTSERARERLQHMILLFPLAALGWTIIALSATPEIRLPGSSLVPAACPHRHSLVLGVLHAARCRCVLAVPAWRERG